MTDFTQAEKDLLLESALKMNRVHTQVSEMRSMFVDLQIKHADIILHLHEIREVLGIEDRDANAEFGVNAVQSSIVRALDAADSKIEYNRLRQDNTICLVKEIAEKLVVLKRLSDLRHTFLARSVHEIQSHCDATTEKLQALTSVISVLSQRFVDSLD